MVLKFLADNPYNITAQSIGVPSSTPTVAAGLANITKILVTIIGMVAVLAIIGGGIQMAVSAGNAKRFEMGRETVTYAVVGLVVAIAALAIVNFVAGSVNGGH